MARILLGVSGGIAAYKAVELVRLATAAGHSVRVVQTPSSLNFVGRATFAAVTGAPVLVDEFEPDPARGAFPGDSAPDHDPISHLELVRRCDALVVAPASANTIAKLAGGHAENLLTSAALACTAPLVLAPAMNEAMWTNPATAANVEALRRRGATIVPPTTGRLASRGEWGAGRLAEPAEILIAVEEVLGEAGQAPNAVADVLSAATEPENEGLRIVEDIAADGDGSLAGVKVLVTAGGTREPIDPVRFVGNRSSGKMGYAVAAVAAARGAIVDLVSAPTALDDPPQVTVHHVETALEMRRAVVSLADKADVVIKAAAVADFRPATYSDQKLKKDTDALTSVALVPNPDILAELGADKGDRLLIGFAAETDLEEERGREKLHRKGLDLIVVNRVDMADSGFNVDTNRAVLLGSDGSRREVPLTTKAELAGVLLDEVEALLRSRR
jgi:phosphopantothenoylcysteine decarboxylase / phosphopantothenate---cysteine ligase